MKLHELGETYLLLSKQIEEMEEERERKLDEGSEAHESGDDITLKAAIDAIADAIEVKAQSIVVMAKQWETEAKALKEEEARLAKRRKAMENRAERLMDYLLVHLRALNVEKLKTRLYSISVTQPKKQVSITDMSLIPEEFLRIPPAEPKKVDIKKAIEQGVIVPGAELVDGEYGIQAR